MTAMKSPWNSLWKSLVRHKPWYRRPALTNGHRQAISDLETSHQIAMQAQLAHNLQTGLRANPSPLGLISTLCTTLESEGIAYCHWKSNQALSRSATGDTDLDLLVHNDDVQRFMEILYRLGFKQVQASAKLERPGVLDYYGYDNDSGKLVHVHAHYRLVLGDDRTKNYRLPIEKAFLASTIKSHGFNIPTPEMEFIVFVIRMVLKRASWDALLEGKGALSSAEREELAYLQARVHEPGMYAILRSHFPFLEAAVFASCLQSLQPASSAWLRMKTAWQLHRALEAHIRRAYCVDLYLKAWRRLAQALCRRVLGHLPRKRFSSGGVMIALIGGDGAGKSTAIEAISRWLSKDFETLIPHMGKPAWSWTTMMVRGFLKLGTSLGVFPYVSSAEVRYASPDRPVPCPGYPLLLREVCQARDRYLTYVKARRFVVKGGIVICDRFPVPQLQTDGPQIAHLTGQRPTTRVLRFLQLREQSYYKSMVMPELLLVLSVPPEVAVQRKTDEDAAYVRARSTEILDTDWQGLDAHVIDASRPKAEVLSVLKAIIWSHL